MYHPQTDTGGGETMIIIPCRNSSQKLRIPKCAGKLQITCPRCRHTFEYRHSAPGLLATSRRPLLIRLAGSLVGFVMVELLQAAGSLDHAGALGAVLSAMLAIGVFGMCLGASMGAAEGLFCKNLRRLCYGLGIGAGLGLIGGAISGGIAQFAYAAILASSMTRGEPSLAVLVLARSVGWCVLGLLIGAAQGIKENTLGDVKFGILGGAIGGAIGGLLFDPLSSVFQVGEGTLGRLAAFVVLGTTIAVAINRLQAGALSSNRREMYQPLTQRLPANPRLLLPGPGTETTAARPTRPNNAEW
jgi:hypothetical protein